MSYWRERKRSEKHPSVASHLGIEPHSRYVPWPGICSSQLATPTGRTMFFLYPLKEKCTVMTPQALTRGEAHQSSILAGMHRDDAALSWGNKSSDRLCTLTSSTSIHRGTVPWTCSFSKMALKMDLPSLASPEDKNKIFYCLFRK